MADPRMEAGNIQDESENSAQLESKEVLKKVYININTTMGTGQGYADVN